jgi:fimbrial chaperone protein
MNRSTLRSVVMAALLSLCAAGQAAAVAVSPNALYIDHRTRSGTLTLFNPGSLPEEITLSFAYGYPRSDAEGRITVPLDSVAPAGEPSVLPWVRAFPRRLRLEPGQRQVVRILVSPPAGLAPGEYWGRIRIHSTGGQPPIEQTVDGNVRTSVSVAMEIVAPVNYRNGDVRTGVRVRQKAVRATPEGAELTLDLEREGNAAFIGRVRAQLVAPDGRVVAEAEDGVAVYRDLRKVLLVPLPEARPLRGYRVSFTLDTERPDLPPESVLSAPPVDDSAVLP